MNDTLPTAGAGPLLAARGLVKTYPGASGPALDGLDLEVRSGEIFGLLGPNGAGKTTSISILCTLLRPDAGSVTVCGEDALRHPRRIKPLIGLVPQEIALYPQLTGRENLAFFGRLYGVSGARLAERVAACLALVGLGEHADRPVAAYSGGMKRRCNLAVGILHEPRLLFLDEPTVGIDAQSRSMILENLLRLRAAGMTMVYTTHYMEEAAQICGRVAVVDHGRVIAGGEPATLVREHAGCANLEDVFLRLTGRQLRD